MKRIQETISRFIRDERGVTAIEYGLVACMVSVTIITSVTYYGTRVRDFLMAAANRIVAP